MGRQSSIKRLPKEVLAEINRLLDAGAILDEIVAHLRELGHPRSRSAVGRYKQEIDQVAEKMRRSRAMAEALVDKIGPAAAEGRTGRMLVEVLQSVVFDHLLKQMEGPGEGEDPASPMDLHFLARALKDMASAENLDTARVLKLRKEFAAEAVKAAERAVDKVAKSGGDRLSAETLKRIREEIYGIVS